MRPSEKKRGPGPVGPSGPLGGGVGAFDLLRVSHLRVFSREGPCLSRRPEPGSPNVSGVAPILPQGRTPSPSPPQQNMTSLDDPVHSGGTPTTAPHTYARKRMIPSGGLKQGPPRHKRHKRHKRGHTKAGV